MNFKKGETNVNNLKDKAPTDANYVILGASGNTGSVIADSLLSTGEKVRESSGATRATAEAALCARARKRSRAT